MNADYLHNNADIEKIINAPSLNLGKWPSPFQKCAAFTNMFIKCDNLSGFGRGGIKTRKIEALLAYYVQKKINHLIIVVPNLSNLRSDVEELAGRLQLNVHFIVANDPPLKKRSFQNTAQVKYIKTGKSWLSTGLAIIKYFILLKFQKGKRVSVVLPGASHPASVIGASKGLLELYNQCLSRQITPPKHIFISASSGSSAAGLVLAALILKEGRLADFLIHVVKVYPVPMKWWIYFLLGWTKKRYRLKVRLDSSSFTVFDNKLAYGKGAEKLHQICHDINHKYGFKVDYIYGARTWDAINEFTASSYDGSGIVFWHCGFTPDAGIFENALYAEKFPATGVQTEID